MNFERLCYFIVFIFVFHCRKHFGNVEIPVEPVKKEDRAKSREQKLWPLREFLDEYNRTDIYAVSAMQKEFAG